MAGRPFHLLPRALPVVVALAVVAASSGCSGSKGPPSLPPIRKSLPSKNQRHSNEGVAYRQQAGQALQPLIIRDEPAPSEAPAAAASGQSAGRAGTLNGDPNGITRETLNRSIQGSMGALAACFTNITHDPMVAVSFEADPSGRPSLVRVSGAPPDAERCIRGVVQGLRFPSFEGKGVQVDLPLSFHRARPAAAPAAQQAQEGAPPLFLEP